MNEKNDNVNCLKEEPLITADQVSVFTLNLILSMSFFDDEKKKKKSSSHFSFYLLRFKDHSFLIFLTKILFVGLTIMNPLF